MRHLKKNNHLSRTSSHRKAMLSNMASSLIIHKRINTTLAKAKALRSYVEPLITKSKDDSTNSRRVVFSYLQNKEAVSELFRDISVKIANRPGGYTRILKTGNRLGDNAEMCMIELVDYNENLLSEKEDKKVKTTRRRRSSGKKKDDEPKAKAVEPSEKKVENKIDEKTEVKEEQKPIEPKTESEDSESADEKVAE
ncbi:MAG: 50S ribosomal protein L17 [Bacteroidales bacterium]|nr:50S ribosomal protein L17 [Bacteroidales bacterium]